MMNVNMSNEGISSWTAETDNLRTLDEEFSWWGRCQDDLEIKWKVSVPRPLSVDVSNRYHCRLEKNHYKSQHNRRSCIFSIIKPKILTVRMLLPTVDPSDSANSSMKRKTICTLTCLSTAVLLIGAAVAFLINFVSWPVNTTIPYTQGVFLICAPRRRSWSGPKGTCLGTPPAATRSTVPS